MITSSYALPPILPSAAHPRLMLTARDLPRIRENLCGGKYPDATGAFRQLCDVEIKGVGATPEAGTYHMKEYLALEAKALDALLSDDADKGRSVIGTLLFLLRHADFAVTYMQARYSGHLIFAAAEVYDWCHKWLNGAEKDEIIARCEAFAEAHFEMGYPPEKQAAISGHGNEAQLLRDLLAFSIAVYDERPDIYAFCAGRLFEEYIPAYEQVFAGEFHPQGPCYGSYRYAWAMWFGLLILAMSGRRVLPEAVGRMADSLLYLTRADGEALRLGDDYNECKAAYTAQNPFGVPLFLAAAYTGNGAHHRAALAQLPAAYLIPFGHGLDFYDEGAFGEGVISPAVFLAFEGMTPLWEPEKRPLGRYFDRPVCATVYNDGERLVLMKLGAFWGANHDHLDTGCFQIYDGEILASDSGVYDSYHTPHRKQYAIGTVAHNCLLVGGEGTRVPCGGKEPKTLAAWLSDYRMAECLFHQEVPERYEIFGDLTAAYAHTCRRVTRSMCFEPDRGERGVLTVTDSVTPKEADAPVTFLLHCQSEPVIKGREILIPGKKKVLRCRVETTSEVEIHAVGGAGRQFEVKGVQYEPQVITAESGWGRVEITARGAVEWTVTMEIGNKNKEIEA